MERFIYCIERIETGKKYIGQHLGSIEDNYWGSGIAIKAAIKKYGVKSFKKYVLAYCGDDDADALEMQYIAEYNTFLGEGYNMDDGGKCNSGYWATRTDEEKALIHKKRLTNRPANFKEIMHEVHRTRDNKAISDKNRGLIRSKETKKKMSESAKKRGVPQEQLEKAWEAKRGSKLTAEQCNNISKATMGKPKSPRTEEHKAKLRKAVVQLDLQGNFIILHDSVSGAGRDTNIDYTSISNVCNGKNKTAGGYLWVWSKDYKN